MSGRKAPTIDLIAPPSSSTNSGMRVRLQLRRYFASLPADARRALKNVRDAVRAAAPGAVESYSYGMPGFRLGSLPLVWYAAWKSHISLYPISDAIRRAADLGEYSASKATIRFPLAKLPPRAVVKRLVRARVTELRAKQKA